MVSIPKHLKPEATLDALETLVGYEFKKKSLLELACIHKSFGNEHRQEKKIDTRDNERLEFLGDAVLDLVISELLLEKFPDSPEGDLSRIRASLVNENSLFLIAQKLNIGRFIVLGKGELQTGGREKESILASTLEAIFAACYLDGGFEAARTVIRGIFELSDFEMDDRQIDYKTRLQEITQAKFKVTPKYELLSTTGPDHDRIFKISVSINSDLTFKAEGKNKKAAEQKAAQTALEHLGKKEK